MLNMAKATSPDSGDPLEGSGFDNETPEPDFDERL